MAKNKKKLFFL